jgi:hypothetical protein
MEAADEEVPNAVKYAGNMVRNALNGLRLAIAPATTYCKIRYAMVMTTDRIRTFAKAESTSSRLPFIPRPRNIPKI